LRNSHGVTIYYRGGLDNNPDLILRLTRWATTSGEAETPDEQDLAEGLN
jgi:hypothetical protein